MSQALSIPRGDRTGKRTRKTAIWLAAVVVVLVAMGFGTKVVNINSTVGAGPQKFDPASWGSTTFPKIQSAIEQRAVPAGRLATALQADQAAAVKKYGVPGTTGPEMSTSFTGTVAQVESGIATVTVAGLPAKLVVRVQVGPAINGTDLRDATGTVTFGQFVNQIDYQNAASALNNRMKTEVLTPLGDPTALAHKTITVVGAFQLINPNGWLVTPVKASVS